MESRADLKRQYKEAPKSAGVFVITNTANGKVFLGSSLNLHGSLNKHRFVLSLGSHWEKALQADWNHFGKDHFTFEIAEIVQHKDDPSFDVEAELELLELIWLEKLQPFGEKGYNRNDRIRE